jgi:hypothetical protein
VLSFYVTEAGGTTGWDVESQADVNVTPLFLPVSFYSAQELGLVQDDPYGDRARTAMLAAVSGMLQAMGISSGKIYAGFEMGATAPRKDRWTMDDIGPGGFELPCYHLPWTEGMPLNALNPGAKLTAGAMLRGEQRRQACRASLFSR